MMRDAPRRLAALWAVTGLIGAGLVSATTAASARQVPAPPPQATYDLLLDARVQVDGAAASDGLGFGVASGDVNGDGIDDIATTSKTGVQVLFGPLTSPVVDLAAAPANGFVVTTPWDLAAGSVASAGDVNGDGRDDLLVPGGSGRLFVVFGKADQSAVSLPDLGSGGFTVRTQGVSVTDFDGAGDVNGDGLADLILVQADTSVAYVVFGRTATSPISIASLGSGGYRISTQGFDQGAPPGSPPVIRSVSDAGDVNRDGRADVLVGSWAFDRSQDRVGAAWVVFGKANTTPVQLGDLGAGGYRIQGSRRYQMAGWNVAAAGDANGDGVPDQLLLGSVGESADAAADMVGQAYVVFGSATSTRTVTLDDDGFRGYQITFPPGDQISTDVQLLGGFDANADGLADQAVSDPQADFGDRPTAGIVYVVTGQAVTQDVDLASYQGGFSIGGPSAGANFGTGIAALADAGTAGILGGAADNGANGRPLSGSVFLVGPPARFPPAGQDLADVRIDVDPITRLAPASASRVRLSATVVTSTALTATMDVGRLVPGRLGGPNRIRCTPAEGPVPVPRRCTAIKGVRSVSATAPGPTTVALSKPLPKGRYIVTVWGTASATGRVSGPYRSRFIVTGRGR